jgi:hypothetical protein
VIVELKNVPAWTTELENFIALGKIEVALFDGKIFPLAGKAVGDTVINAGSYDVSVASTPVILLVNGSCTPTTTVAVCPVVSERLAGERVKRGVLT